MNRVVFVALAASINLGWSCLAQAADADSSDTLQSAWAAYLDASGTLGWDRQKSAIYDDTDPGDANVFSHGGYRFYDVDGGARAAWHSIPTLSFQLDAWGGRSWAEGFAYPTDTFAVGAHADVRGSRGLFGALVSTGWSSTAGNTLQSANFGVEAKAFYSMGSVYGQVGYTCIIYASCNSAAGSAGFYGHVATSFFFNPNLSVGFDAAYGTLDNTSGFFDRFYSAGVRIEKKFDAVPISVYLAATDSYSTRFARDPDPPHTVNDFRLNDVTIRLGARLAIGDTSLQALDQDVGLVDMNVAYGDSPH